MATWKKKPEGWARVTADMAAYQREWRKANPEKCAKYEQKREYSPEKERLKYERKMRRLHGDDWKPLEELSQEEKILRARARSKKKKLAHPGKHRARKSLNMAVSRGRVIPEPCFMCGARAQAHHSSYAPDMQLAVTWLCPEHHRQVHAEDS